MVMVETTTLFYTSGLELDDFTIRINLFEKMIQIGMKKYN